MVRPIRDTDIGLKVLYPVASKSSSEVEITCDIVAVHGLGAHPDDTWTSPISSGDVPKAEKLYKNWLQDHDMLPEQTPSCRIMRYGYHSQWFGANAIKTKASKISRDLLFELKQCRESCMTRPLIFIAHGFGGLVVLQTLIDAFIERHEWNDIHQSTVGLIFLGTPFRGTHNSLSQGETLQIIEEHFDDMPIHSDNIRILRTGDESLTNLVDTYFRVSRQTTMPQVACFYEQRASNVGKLVNRDHEIVEQNLILVDETSGCLDMNPTTEKYGLPRNNFNIQKFGDPNEQGFRRICSVIKSMMEKADSIMQSRLDCEQICSLWYVPFDRGQGFVGRKDELDKLKKKFSQQDGGTMSIVGLGGVGKSRLALEFAYQVRMEQPKCSIFWVRATTQLTFEKELLEIGKQLKIPGIADGKADVKSLVKQRLNDPSMGKWLFILDNADDPVIWGHRLNSRQQSNLVSCLPKSKHGLVLITTRTQDIATDRAGKEVIRLSALSPSDAFFMLRHGLENPNLVGNEAANDNMTLALLEKLTFLPLAIVQATAFINKTQVSIKTYLDLLNDDDEEEVIKLLSEEFEDPFRYEDASNPIATTWLISFKHIHMQNKHAAELLCYMACLQEKNIPLSLLPEVASKIDRVKAMGVLIGYSLVTQQPTNHENSHGLGKMYDMHRLVQYAVRNWLRMANYLSCWTEECIIRVAEVFPSRKHEDKSMLDAYILHSRFLCAANGTEDLPERYLLLQKMGRYFLADGSYDEAVKMHTVVIK